MVDEIARWRIAYDTISALVAVDHTGAEASQGVSPSHVTAGAAGAGRGGGAGARYCAASYTSSHRDSRDMIQRQRRVQQQQQQRGADVPSVQLTQPSLSTLSTVLHSPHSPTSPVASSSRLQSAGAMTSVAAECDVTTRLMHDGQALVALYRRLVETFYVEAMLWMYTSVLLQPSARPTRNRLRWLGVVTGRTVEQAASNVLVGFVAGYRQSRQSLNHDVEVALGATTAVGRAERLARLSVELGVVLNARQMMRAFCAVVRDLVFRASSHTALATTGTRLYRYESGHHRHHHHHHHHHQHRQRHATCHADRQHVSSSSTRLLAPPPPPPPPYPGFLLHFLSVLDARPVLPSSVYHTSADASISDNASYEELLRLSDEIGDVKERGLTLDDVQQLPSYHVPSESHSNRHSVHVCVICLDQFTSGQMIRALPCYHEYHAKCVDRWLTMNRTCPVCRYDIDPASIQPLTCV